MAEEALSTALALMPDLLCFSHLRWDFVFQRPQHLMSRFSRHTKVYFIEEPIVDAKDHSYMEVRELEGSLWVVIPHIQESIENDVFEQEQRKLLQQFMHEYNIISYIAWYYTPMAITYSRQLQPEVIIYDCMDELSAFKFAPTQLPKLENELFTRADLVFTGGQSLYEAKKTRHTKVYCFPSSIDYAHFAQARLELPEPEDQKHIPHPRLGFYGVLDERLDIALLTQLSRLRSDWQFILIGPVVKIDADSLPRSSNIHYLGMKSYCDLPQYLSGWDIALLLFAMNESTKFISPTKTPEYLAAGKPVVSTPIMDVVHPYQELNLVHIADNEEAFVHAAESALKQIKNEAWMNATDAFLSQNSWGRTWESMVRLILTQLESKISK